MYIKRPDVQHNVVWKIIDVRAPAVEALSIIIYWHSWDYSEQDLSAPKPFFFIIILLSNNIHIPAFASEWELIITRAWGATVDQFITSQLTHPVFPSSPPLSSTPGWFTMTTETGADSEAKQPQKNKETEKGKAEAAEPTSPQNQPEQLPAAVGHSTPARKEQVSFLITAATKRGFSWSSWRPEFT